MHSFKHIICPVDFSEPTLNAVAYAATLAEALKLPLELLHVIAPLPVYPSAPEAMISMPPVTPPDDNAREGAARQRLQDLQRQLQDRRVAATIQVLHGMPGRTIVDRVREIEDALLVMGTHGYAGFQRFVLGSTAAEVLRRAACPVLTVREPESGRLPKEIGVAVDFSACSEPAIEYAARLARTFEARLHLVHIRPPVEVPTVAETHVPLYIDKIAEANEHAAQRELDDIAARIGGVEVRKVVLTGSTVYRDIVHYAQTEHLDLLAMGTHGRTGLRRLFLGSTAERTMQVAPCPVMTVKPPADVPAEISWREVAEDLRLPVEPQKESDL